MTTNHNFNHNKKNNTNISIMCIFKKIRTCQNTEAYFFRNGTENFPVFLKINICLQYCLQY